MNACPEEKPLKRIQAFFDRHAEGWDAGIAPEYCDRAAAMVAEWPIAPGSRVLDVGCGTGVLLPSLARKVGGEGVVAAVDLSREMLAKARDKGNFGTAALWLQADVTAGPFPPACFDWVLCYSVFPHFEDQAGVMAELARTLRPGGRLVVCHSQSREAINAFHETVGDVVGGHVLPDDEAMRALVAGAGLNLETLDNFPDRYVMVAAKPTTGEPV